MSSSEWIGRGAVGVWGAPPSRGVVRVLLVVALCGLLATPQGATAQAQVPRPAGAPPAKPYELSVTSEGGYIAVALRADRARVPDIAAELASRLRAQVKVGPVLAGETLTTDFRESPLETALASMAPRVLIDYELRQGTPPRPLVIHLLASDDAEVPSPTVAQGASEGVLIEGHTEEPADSEPLKVAGDRHSLSITSVKQPLGVVAMAVGALLGVPVELGDVANDTIDLDLTNVPAEDAIVGLSPKVRLTVRVDVTRAERTPLRLVVSPPAPQQ